MMDSLDIQDHLKLLSLAAMQGFFVRVGWLDNNLFLILTRKNSTLFDTPIHTNWDAVTHCFQHTDNSY